MFGGEVERNTTTTPGTESARASVEPAGRKAQKAPKKAPVYDSPRKRKRGQEGGFETDLDETEGSEDGEGEFEFEMRSDTESVRGSDEESDNEEEVEQWDEEGDEDEEKKPLCIHCGQDEDHDPAPDWEEPLECSICRVFSHLQCDRTANEEGAVKSAYDEDSSTWRCPTCAANDLIRPSQATEESRQSRRRTRQDSTTSNDDTRPRRLRKRKSDDIEDVDAAIRTRKFKRRGSKDSMMSTDRAIPSQPIQEELSTAIQTDEGSDVVTNGARRRKKENKFRVVVTANLPHKMIISMRGLTPDKLGEILLKPPKPSRSRGAVGGVTRGRTPARRLKNSTTQPGLTTSTNLYPIAWEDPATKPYGGILTEEEANTAETVPGQQERARFDEAKRQAEEEQKMRAQLNKDTSVNKRRVEGSRVGEASLIECIHFGKHEIDTWYAAPYPEEYSLNKVLWICEFCLKYMNSEYVCWRHKLKCPTKHPPGDEIYRSGSISIFEIDGRKQPVYCQNLCLLAKLFLGSKTLYYDVHPFLFYVMTESDDYGLHFVGYFSKEKRDGSQNNVSCILTLPIHQRKGYGNLLIDFSYLLTRVEGKTGSPEKPFSDLGLVSYRNYWKLQLCYQLRAQHTPLTISDLSARTGMTPDDIICGLESLRALVRDPVTKTYALRLDYALLESTIQRWEAKGYVKLNPAALLWTPYLMGRSQAEKLDEMPMSTIAPRPGDTSESSDEEDDDAETIPPGTPAPMGGMGLTAGSPVFSGLTPEPPNTVRRHHHHHRASPPRDIPPERFEVVPQLGGPKLNKAGRRSGGAPGSRMNREAGKRKRPAGKEQEAKTPRPLPGTGARRGVGGGGAAKAPRHTGGLGLGKGTGVGGGKVVRGKEGGEGKGRAPSYGKAPRGRREVTVEGEGKEEVMREGKE